MYAHNDHFFDEVSYFASKIIIRDKKWLLCAYDYVILFDISFLSHLGTFEISIFIKNREFGPPADKKSEFGYFFCQVTVYTLTKKVNLKWDTTNSLLSNKQWNVK